MLKGNKTLRRNIANWSHVGRPASRAIALSVTLALGIPAPLLAQSNPNAIPFGSPLDPYVQTNGDTSSSSNTIAAYPTPAVTSPAAGAIEPADINRNSKSERDDSGDSNNRFSSRTVARMAPPPLKKPAPPGEFEKFVSSTLGRDIPRFGNDLLIQAERDFSKPATAAIPADYIISPGDQIFIGLAGSIEGTLDAEVDNNGQVFLPKVGPVKIAGVAYGDLKRALQRAIGTQYRDFRVSVAITKFRGVRVYVTGFANNPGSYSLSSLSTLINAVLAAGGPSSGGSFRTIKLYRNGKLVRDFDLYDFLRGGDKSRDTILLNEDVLYIPPVGPQVAITGSVNAEAIYETKSGETLAETVALAGGPAGLADKSRAILYRIDNRDKTGGVELSRADLASVTSSGGDILQFLSSGSLIQPLERQSVVVRIEGEVNRPGNYYVQPNTSLSAVLALAGGTTSRAYLFGTNFQRVSVRIQQRESFNEAINQFETSLAAAPLVNDPSLNATTGGSQVAAAKAVLERLRQTEPDGRVVIDSAPGSASLPTNMVLENNDRIYIPPVPTTVGVFGAVYRPASFLLQGGKPRNVEGYLNMAGGIMRAGDKGQIFVVRANGAVISKRRGALGAAVLPGDVIFVPVKTEASSFWTRLQQISTIFFQLGISTAAFVAVAK